MSKKEELFSATGRDKLEDLYSKKEFSIRQVAKELGVYPVLVYQALLHHQIPVRNKSSAQSKALDKGRSTHPTKRKQREQKTKVKIGETLYKKWKANRKELTEKWRKKGIEVWNSISDEKKEEIKERASQALKKSSQFGSKLEEFLFSYLSVNNFRCVHHKKHLVSAEQLEIDIFLPEDAICIEVDGISHFYPIFGEQDLQRRIDADNKKNGLLLAAGYVIIRIRNLKNFVSQAALRDVGGKLVKIINKLKVSFPDNVEDRLIYLDIGDMINE
jgi:very-short-patch-repair endonuclease